MASCYGNACYLLINCLILDIAVFYISSMNKYLLCSGPKHSNLWFVNRFKYLNFEIKESKWNSEVSITIFKNEQVCLPSVIFSLITDRKSSRSARACSCQNPRACPISWATMPFYKMRNKNNVLLSLLFNSTHSFPWAQTKSRGRNQACHHSVRLNELHVLSCLLTCLYQGQVWQIGKKNRK
jgi:hypothetical protein